MPTHLRRPSVADTHPRRAVTPRARSDESSPSRPAAPCAAAPGRPADDRPGRRRAGRADGRRRSDPRPTAGGCRRCAPGRGSCRRASGRAAQGGVAPDAILAPEPRPVPGRRMPRSGPTRRRLLRRSELPRRASSRQRCAAAAREWRPWAGRTPGPGQLAANGCTAPQLRQFIKSRPYVPMHELRRRFGIDGGRGRRDPGAPRSGTRSSSGCPSARACCWASCCAAERSATSSRSTRERRSSSGSTRCDRSPRG